ncbi:MAG: quinone-dependent dihydroorotate dehydrogenase [Verrucomicrobiota bacterium]
MYSLIRPLFFKLDPEFMHDVALHALTHTPMAALLTLGRSAPQKPVQLWGLNFRNPLGLASGFDKDAVAISAWERLGFGFVEVGTVTPKLQAGNPKKRIFRIPSHQAVINRMGFPNSGADAVVEHLHYYRHHCKRADFPIGINIGKGKETPLENAAGDYLECFQKLHDWGDFFVINVSSPNTPGLRDLQQPEFLKNIFSTLQEFNRQHGQKPLLVKIAPDLALEDIAKILEVAIANNLSGIVATNTTIDHSSVPLKEKGGLSGAPLRQKSTEIVRFIHKETQGRLPIIGVGGVFTKDDFQEKLDAGASLVQLYTGFIYEGPWVAHKILR